MDTIRITTAQNIDIDFEVAGLGERILARLIDGGVIIAVFILVGVTSLVLELKESTALTIVAVIILAVAVVFYDLLFEVFLNGQSPGKRIMKIKVVSLDGHRPSFSQYLLRWLFRLIDFSLTGGVCALITVAVSDNKQRVGDMIAGTTLIRTRPRTKMESIAFAPDAEDYQPVFPEAARLTDKDIVLIHDVITNYIKIHNNVVVYNMAVKIKTHLGLTLPAGMNDMQFLQTIIKDYNHLSVQADMI